MVGEGRPSTSFLAADPTFTQWNRFYGREWFSSIRPSNLRRANSWMVSLRRPEQGLPAAIEHCPNLWHYDIIELRAVHPPHHPPPPRCGHHRHRRLAALPPAADERRAFSLGDPGAGAAGHT